MKILVDERLMEKNAYAGDAGQTALLVQLLEVFTWLVLRPLGAIDVYVDSFLLLAEMRRWYWRIKRGKCLHLDKPSLMGPGSNRNTTKASNRNTEIPVFGLK